MGYVLVAFLAGGDFGVAAATFYLVAYCITMLAAFSAVSALSNSDRDAQGPADYTALATRRPGLALVLTAALFSLAGIPLTAGFMGKAYVLAGGAAAQEWPLLLVLVISSVIGLYYYLRVVIAVFAAPEPDPPHIPRTPLAAALALAVLLLLVIWLGAYPGPAMETVAGLVSGLR